MASGSIGADILLRALAIFLVVGDHASANRYIGGGAILLLMLAGFNLARFNRTALATGRVGEMLKRLAQNILAPYYLMILAYGLWKGEFVLSTVLLVSNWTNDTHGFLVPFWFIGAYVQTMLLVAALSVVSPRFRRTVAADPWRCGVVGFLASMVLTFAIGRLGWSAYGRSLDAVLPVFALGWCIAFADSPPRRFIVVLATIAYLAIDRGGFQLFSRDVSQAWPEIVTLSLAVMAMLFAPRLPFPRFLRGIAVAVAAATFTIYLTHTLVIWTIAKAVGHDNPGLWVAPLALAFGVVCHRVLGDISRRGSTSLTAIRVRPPERRVL